MEKANDKIRISSEEIEPHAADRIVVLDLNPSPASSPPAGSVPQKRTTATLLILVVALLIVLAGVSVYFLWPKRNWITSIDEAASRSIVRIETADGLGSGFVIASKGNRHLILTQPPRSSG